MRWMGRWVRRLAAPFRRAESDRGMDEEMRFHLEMETRELVAAGHSPAEARRLARVRFGGVERYREEGREARGGRLPEEVVQDLRYAVRGLARRPAFTAAVVTTLAVGIGATTAVWSLVDGVLLRPLPYTAPERLVRVQASWEGEPRAALSPPEYLDYRRDGGDVFASLGAYARGATTVTGGAGGAERVDVAVVAADLFRVLAVEPVVGRPFTAAEEVAGDRVLVLAEGYWRQRFGGDPGVPGRTVDLAGTPYTVVGVMPVAFRLPENMVEGSRPDLYVPLGIGPEGTYNRGSHYLQAAARLAPGVSLDRAAEAVESITARFVADHRDDYSPEMGFRATAVPLREAVVGEVRPAALVALGAVVLVLLVAAANVAALLLARGESRRGEMALRSTLGAARPRLVRQLLVETLLLAAIGGAFGLALAWAGVQGLLALDPAGIPRLEELAVDARVLAFAAGLSVLCGVLFGLLPAFRTAPAATGRALREEGARTAGTGSRRLRRALVVGEIGFALALLTGAGLLGRSMGELLAVDTGLRIDDVIAAQFVASGPRYGEAEAVRDFVEQVTTRVAALAEVHAAGAVTNLPLAEPLGDLGVLIPGKELPGEGNLDVDWQAVTPGYDRAVGLRLLGGRWIDPSDRADAPGAVVINRTFAATWWPEDDALGATIRLSGGAAPAEARVVGVVEDVRHEGPSTPARLQMYLPHRQFRFWAGGGAARGVHLAARVRPGATTAPAAIRGVIAELDPDIGLGPFLTLERAYRDTLSRPRLLTGLMAAFAGIALLLAAVGVYGVIAFSVGQRRREFGIRLALGARSGRVARDVVAEAAVLAGVGVGLGMAGALLLSGALRSLLFGVSAADPWVLGGGAAVLMATALLASWLPARRAMRVDPAEALRAE